MEVLNPVWTTHIGLAPEWSVTSKKKGVQFLYLYVSGMAMIDFLCRMPFHSLQL